MAEQMDLEREHGCVCDLDESDGADDVQSRHVAFDHGAADSDADEKREQHQRKCVNAAAKVKDENSRPEHLVADRCQSHEQRGDQHEPRRDRIRLDADAGGRVVAGCLDPRAAP